MKNRNKRMHRLGRAAIEALESRVVLDGTVTSAVVGDMLFTAVASGTTAGGTDLFRSDLDGSDQVLLGHWQSNTSENAPTSLFGFHGELFFVAGTQAYWSRATVWKSDGTVEGTVRVGNITQHGSWPHDFFVVNDHLLYLAQDNGHRDQIFFTDGQAWGQLIAPPTTGYPGAGAYRFGYSRMTILNDRLYAEVGVDIGYNSSLFQTERWQTDGSPQGTRIADPFGMIHDGELRIFGSTGNDTIHVTSIGGFTRLSINGRIQRFDNSTFTGIFIGALQGDDSITLAQTVTHPARIQGNGGDDTIIGGRGNDGLNGGADDDWIDGGGGDDQITGGYSPIYGGDTLLGGRGNDTITGSAGDDEINGGGGNDSISGNRGYDVMNGDNGDDTIGSGYENVTIHGGAGDDILSGGTGDDCLIGESGNDSIRGSAGEDTLDGGAGADTQDGGGGLDLIISDALDVVIDLPSNLTGGLLDVLGTFGDDLIEIRLKSDDPGTIEVAVNGQRSEFPASIQGMNVATGAGEDVVIVDPAVLVRATIKGGEGNDSIRGGGRGDLILGEEGADTLDGGDGNDTLDGGVGDDVLDGGNGTSDQIPYSSRVERIVKNPNEKLIFVGIAEVDAYIRVEALICGLGDDFVMLSDEVNDLHYVEAGKGNNVIVGGAASDSIIGGGRDTLIGNGSDDEISGTFNTEPVYADGGEGDDRLNLYGTRGQNTILGGGGHDWITGGSGDDFVDAGNDVDWIEDEAGKNTLTAGDGNDQIHAYGDNDLVDAGEGDDVIDCLWFATVYAGAGDDVIFNAQFVEAGLGDDYIQGSQTVLGGAGRDTIVNSLYADGGADDDLMYVEPQGPDPTLIGGEGNDSISGSGYDDLLIGGPGDDTLNGGPGADTLDGGPGNDVFISDAFDTIIDPPPPPLRSPVRTPTRAVAMLLGS